MSSRAHRLVAVTGASNLLGTRPRSPDLRARPRGRRPRLRRRRPLHPAHHRRCRRAGRGLLRLLALQVLRPALCALLAPTRPAGVHPSRQAAAVHRRRARAVRVRHAAVRDHGRRHGGGRLHRRSRARRWDRRERLVAAYRLIDDHEIELRRRIEAAPAALGDRVVVHSRAVERTPTLFFTFPAHDALEASRFLADRGFSPRPDLLSLRAVPCVGS